METRVPAFLAELATWASEQDDVRAVVLLGSQARVDEPADEVSDVDVVLFVAEPARYLRDDAWVERFGEPLLTFVEATAVGGFEERRVLFRDGLEVDFALPPAAAAGEIPPDAREVFARGFLVLYDAEEVARALRATGDLFARLEDEVASRFGLTPSADRDEIFRRLEALLV